jgi:hypothetical protein
MLPVDGAAGEAVASTSLAMMNLAEDRDVAL